MLGGQFFDNIGAAQDDPAFEPQQIVCYAVSLSIFVAVGDSGVHVNILRRKAACQMGIQV
jgi:hypothetical protein